MYCTQCGTRANENDAFCKNCGGKLGIQTNLSGQSISVTIESSGISFDTNNFIRRIADYEKISAVLWLILGILQIISIVAIIAGIWNIFAAISRFKIEKEIRNRSNNIPTVYQGTLQLVILGIINLLLGAVIGVIWWRINF